MKRNEDIGLFTKPSKLMIADAWDENLSNSLVGNRVQVWCAWLADFVGFRETLAATLSPDEKSRASRFFHLIDGERFVLRRGLLRYILGSYTGFPPSRLRLNYQGNGKPVLAPLPAGRSLQFNLSHSNGVAVYAVAQCGEVGIDVEQVRDLTDWLGIVQEHFSKREQDVMLGIPETLRLEAFYRGWTRKEALLKATGQGIGGGLSQIEVSLEPNKPARIKRIEGSTTLASEWTITDLPTFPGFVGALAVRVKQIAIHDRMCQATREVNLQSLSPTGAFGRAKLLKTIMEV